MPLWWAGSGSFVTADFSIVPRIPPSGDHVMTKNGARNAVVTGPEEKSSGPVSRSAKSRRESSIPWRLKTPATPCGTRSCKASASGSRSLTSKPTSSAIGEDRRRRSARRKLCAGIGSLDSSSARWTGRAAVGPPARSSRHISARMAAPAPSKILHGDSEAVASGSSRGEYTFSLSAYLPSFLLAHTRQIVFFNQRYINRPNRRRPVGGNHGRRSF